MKFSYHITILMLVVSCSQNQTVPIVYNGIQGVIFTEDYRLTYPDGEIVDAAYFIFTDRKTKEWTVNMNDVVIVEDKLKTSTIIPFVESDLKEYYRNYIGYVDTLGNKNIWLSFTHLTIKNSIVEEGPKDMPIFIADGDSLFFTVHYSLKDSIFFDFRFY